MWWYIACTQAEAGQAAPGGETGARRRATDGVQATQCCPKRLRGAENWRVQAQERPRGVRRSNEMWTSAKLAKRR